MKELSFEIKIPKFQFSADWRGRIRSATSILIFTGAFFAMKKFDFTFFGTLILAYFGLAILWEIESRVAAALALFFLAGCPVLLIMKNDSLAETFAIYAYYFLVIAVVGEIIDLKRKK